MKIRIKKEDEVTLEVYLKEDDGGVWVWMCIDGWYIAGITSKGELQRQRSVPAKLGLKMDGSKIKEEEEK